MTWIKVSALPSFSLNRIQQITSLSVVWIISFINGDDHRATAKTEVLIHVSNTQKNILRTGPLYVTYFYYYFLFYQSLILYHKKVSFSASDLTKTPAESCNFLLMRLSSPAPSQNKNLLLGNSSLFLVVLPNLNISLVVFLLPATVQNSTKNSSLKLPIWPKNHTYLRIIMHSLTLPYFT